MSSEAQAGNGDLDDLVDSLESIESDEDLLGEYGVGPNGDGDDRLRAITEWLPDHDQWQGKTNITEEQARELAAARLVVKYFDELDEIEADLTQYINDYEMYLTSVDGAARREQVGVLRSLFGSGALGGGGDNGLAFYLSAPDDSD